MAVANGLDITVTVAMRGRLNGLERIYEGGFAHTYVKLRASSSVRYCVVRGGFGGALCSVCDGGIHIQRGGSQETVREGGTQGNRAHS